MIRLAIVPLAALSLLLLSVEAAKNAVQGTKCARNQVVNKITVYEDGAIEAECGPMPCGNAGERCIDDQTTCKAESDTFSGMRWAPNGQSLALRCCSAAIPSKIYVGTDLVTLGSYYTGGLVAKKDKYGKDGGAEFDYVTNLRTEQGGVRVWVYRIMCPPSGSEQSPKQIAENQDAQPESVAAGSGGQQPEVASVVDPRVEASSEPVNPLQYRPPPQQRTQRHPSAQRGNAEARLL